MRLFKLLNLQQNCVCLISILNIELCKILRLRVKLMGIIRILKRALRPNKRRETGNKTGLVGPSFQRKAERESQINEP